MTLRYTFKYFIYSILNLILFNGSVITITHDTNANIIRTIRSAGTVLNDQFLSLYIVFLIF